MKTACFTIVKNEKYFLPILEEYYTKEFDDFYVLNHNSTDGSIEKLKPTTKVVNINNDVVFDHEWLVNTVMDFHLKLFEDYDVVCFVEADEFLIHRDKSLRQVCQELFDNEGLDVIRSNGYDLIHNSEENDFLEGLGTILEHKKTYMRDEYYDKCLISKKPLRWSYGFHHTHNVDPSRCYQDKEFYLIHLHYFDKNIYKNRVEDRLQWKEELKDDGMGIQNKITKIEESMQWFEDWINKDIPKINLNLPNLF